MLYERSHGHLAWAKGSLRARRQAGGRQSARLVSVRWGGGGHRLQSCWLGGQLMDGLCRVPKTATIYVKTGVVRSNAIAMGLEADASRASPAPTSHPGDIRVTDPNSRVAVWEGDDD